MKQTVDLKTERHGLKELDSFVPLQNRGRFYEVKVGVRELTTKIPAGEFDIIPYTKTLQTDRKERAAFHNAVYQTLRNIGWSLRYGTKGFILIRLADWDSRHTPPSASPNDGPPQRKRGGKK